LEVSIWVENLEIKSTCKEERLMGTKWLVALLITGVGWSLTAWLVGCCRGAIGRSDLFNGVIIFCVMLFVAVAGFWASPYLGFILGEKVQDGIDPIH